MGHCLYNKDSLFLTSFSSWDYFVKFLLLFILVHLTIQFVREQLPTINTFMVFDALVDLHVLISIANLGELFIAHRARKWFLHRVRSKMVVELRQTWHHMVVTVFVQTLV